jgi:8-oxo-dGTP pyrophosphatase MutT (NUDIX family)
MHGIPYHCAMELHQALTTYARTYPNEASKASRFLQLLEAGDAAFAREHRPGHLTGSGWITDESGAFVLLTHHHFLDMWLQLGGHADGQTDIWSVAEREVWEESGLSSARLMSREILDIDIHPIDHGGFAHEHFDVRFLFVADPSEPVTVSDESHDVKWVELSDLARYTEEDSMFRMRDKALALMELSYGRTR